MPRQRITLKQPICWSEYSNSYCLCDKCWSCKRKIKYDNPLLAKQTAKLASFRAKELIQHYKCRYCDDYHIGHVHIGI